MFKRKTLAILIFLLALTTVIFFTFWIFKNNSSQKNSTENIEMQNTETISINNKTIQVEIADTPELREKGLMFRESLCQDCGMLFIFENEGIYGFWMKDTLIPLDIAWINNLSADRQDRWEIVDIATLQSYVEGKNPDQYKPNQKALYVLEVNSGYFEKNNIKIGTRVDFKMLEL